MRLIAAILSLFSLVAPALAQGWVPAALSSNVDQNGRPIAGGLLYVYVNATTTPQTCYQDLGLTIPMPFPIVADNAGRIPLFYCPPGQVHLRFTTAQGALVYDYPTVLVAGATGGGGGGGPGVDPTTISSSGDIKFRMTSETLTGWVKLNGTTIGSAASGATQRANADTFNLFSYLWANCTQNHCAVSGGRGSSAAIDFAANKTLALPDWRDRAPFGLDDMGTSAKGANPPILSGGGDTATTPGAWGGGFNSFIAQANLPAVPPTGVVTATSNPTVAGSFTPSGTVTIGSAANNTGTVTIGGTFTPSGSVAISGGWTPSGSIAMGGSATPTITSTISGTQTLNNIVNSSTGTAQSITVTGSSYRIANLTVDTANFAVASTSSAISGSSFTGTFTGNTIAANTVIGAGFTGNAINANGTISATYAGKPIDGTQLSGNFVGNTITANTVIGVVAGGYSFTGNNLGSGASLATASPFILGTWLMKLATPVDLHICDMLSCEHHNGEDI